MKLNRTLKTFHRAPIGAIPNVYTGRGTLPQGRIRAGDPDKTDSTNQCFHEYLQNLQLIQIADKMTNTKAKQGRSQEQSRWRRCVTGRPPQF